MPNLGETSTKNVVVVRQDAIVGLSKAVSFNDIIQQRVRRTESPLICLRIITQT